MLLRFDGGANPNPGPCAGAFVLYADDGSILHEGGTYFPHGTNNIGEYSGLLLGLKCCLEHAYLNIHVEGDSMLVIEQMRGKWQVKNETLKQFHHEAKAIVSQLQSVTFAHIRREFNSYADSLSDRTLELKSSW